MCVRVAVGQDFVFYGIRTSLGEFRHVFLFSKNFLKNKTVVLAKWHLLSVRHKYLSLPQRALATGQNAFWFHSLEHWGKVINFNRYILCCFGYSSLVFHWFSINLITVSDIPDPCSNDVWNN